MSQPIPQNKVKTEVIRLNKGDRFDIRWLPVYDIPSRVRTISVNNEVKSDEVVSARPAVAPIDQNTRLITPPEQNETVQNTPTSVPVNKRRTKVAYVYTRDQRTCLKHDMRTVYYGKYRWRCKR